jgi:hypothetical protein
MYVQVASVWHTLYKAPLLEQHLQNSLSTVAQLPTYNYSCCVALTKVFGAALTLTCSMGTC